MIQELLEAVQENSEPDYTSAEEDSEVAPGQVVMVVQHASVEYTSVRKNRTLRLRGFIGKQEILILVDSGSAETFVSQELASQIQQEQIECKPLQFTSADGNKMLSNQMIPQLQWHVQGHYFTYDTRILPFKGYDMILGADWLEDHSPIWIHWKKKLLKFTADKQRIMLKGITDTVPWCSQISGHKLKGLIRKKVVSHILEVQAICPLQKNEEASQSSIEHLLSISSDKSNTTAVSDMVSSEIQQLLTQYEHLFQEPTALPLKRPYDHQIPLVAGSQSINVRPYRYAPQ